MVLVRHLYLALASTRICPSGARASVETSAEADSAPTSQFQATALDRRAPIRPAQRPKSHDGPSRSEQAWASGDKASFLMALSSSLSSFSRLPPHRHDHTGLHGRR